MPQEKQAPVKSVTLSNLALTHLVGELQIFVNGFLNNSQSLDNGWLKLKIHTKLGDKLLLVTDNTLFISNKSIPAKQNPGGFSALIKKHLFNQRIISLTQYGADRLVILEFPEKFLILELFAKGNIILCEKDYKIIKAMRKEEWKDRKLEMGEIYKFPSSKGIAPLKENLSEFFNKIQTNTKTSFGAVMDTLNTAPAVLEKVFGDINIDKKINASELTRKQTDLILKSVQNIYSEKSNETYLSSGVLYSADLNLPKERTFSSVNEALNELINIESEIVKKVVTSATPQAQKKINHEHKFQIINMQLEGLAKKEIEMKDKGDFIYLHYAEIKQVLELIKKGKEKGLKAKEIMEKINSIKPMIFELDLEKDKLKLRL